MTKSRLELAQKQLRRHERIRDTIRHYESLCRSCELRVAEANAELGDARERLAESRKQLQDFEPIRIALESRMAEIAREEKQSDEALRNAIKVRDSLKALGMPVPIELIQLIRNSEGK